MDMVNPIVLNLDTLLRTFKEFSERFPEPHDQKEMREAGVTGVLVSTRTYHRLLNYMRPQFGYDYNGGMPFHLLGIPMWPEYYVPDGMLLFTRKREGGNMQEVVKIWILPKVAQGAKE